MWEFSGNPVYYCSYDCFAANDHTAIHLVLFSLEEPYEAQLNQVTFWLNLLKSLTMLEDGISAYGCQRHFFEVDSPLRNLSAAGSSAVLIAYHVSVYQNRHRQNTHEVNVLYEGPSCVFLCLCLCFRILSNKIKHLIKWGVPVGSHLVLWLAWLPHISAMAAEFACSLHVV